MASLVANTLTRVIQLNDFLKNESFLRGCPRKIYARSSVKMTATSHEMSGTSALNSDGKEKRRLPLLSLALPIGMIAAVFALSRIVDTRILPTALSPRFVERPPSTSISTTYRSASSIQLDIIETMKTKFLSAKTVEEATLLAQSLSDQGPRLKSALISQLESMDNQHIPDFRAALMSIHAETPNARGKFPHYRRKQRAKWIHDLLIGADDPQKLSNPNPKKAMEQSREMTTGRRRRKKHRVTIQTSNQHGNRSLATTEDKHSQHLKKANDKRSRRKERAESEIDIGEVSSSSLRETAWVVAMLRSVANTQSTDAATFLLKFAYSLQGIFRDECGALIRQMDHHAIPALLEARFIKHPIAYRMSRYARYQLEQMGKIQPGDVLRAAPYVVQLRLIDAYARIQDPHAVREILSYVSHSDELIRKHARRAVKQYLIDSGVDDDQPEVRFLTLPGGRVSKKEEALFLTARELVAKKIFDHFRENRRSSSLKIARDLELSDFLELYKPEEISSHYFSDIDRTATASTDVVATEPNNT